MMTNREQSLSSIEKPSIQEERDQINEIITKLEPKLKSQKNYEARWWINPSRSGRIGASIYELKEVLKLLNECDRF
jgi:hypothetical protein